MKTQYVKHFERKIYRPTETHERLSLLQPSAKEHIAIKKIHVCLICTCGW